MPPLPISGYILAGGRSSRMGTDKALLPLAGKPLIAHAVAKLRRICADVHILSNNPALAAYAPLVPDLHPDCGPIGGIEAALIHSPNDWNLILPVDVPFLPVAILQEFVASTIAPAATSRVAMFTVDGHPQPAVCLLHKDVAPSFVAAVSLVELKLLSVLEAAANVLALQRHQPPNHFLSYYLVPNTNPDDHALWFANLNTPQDFAVAEANAPALDA